MNERAIFEEALQRQTPEERSAYLDQACAGDAAMRQRLEALLKSHEDAGAFLAKPVPERLVESQESATSSDPFASETPDTMIGPYKLLERIGEGGMGTVWMAQQSEPVKRLVALKLIKAGMDSKQVIARFEAERQALALMDHPNIAKVLDAGTVSHKPDASARDAAIPLADASGLLGRPYFVMELVKGVPITLYCDERHLTPRQRLELFIPVCHAIQHAHQKGIIHRDLKPSNVLVALYDDRPVPKVIDFGVAKAAGKLLTEQSLVTGFGAIVGTLEYMSPEQAEFNQLDIDTRSDIYALGVLLYELLTGMVPFSCKELENAGMLEMLRVIREQEPSKPSTKLSTADGLPTLAANRGTEPATLTRLVRGELDWIVMKALEKDRNRRYQSANNLALDVQRYLADEPVTAGPPSRWYRLRKFAQRNKVIVAATSVVALAVLTGAAVAAWQAVRATLAQRDALTALNSERTAKAVAEAREAETAAMLHFVQSHILAAARPQGQEGGLGRDVSLRRAIEEALPFLAVTFTNQPLVEARLRMTLGNSFGHLGEAKIAGDQYQRARTLFTEHIGHDHPDTLKSMYNLANSYHARGWLAEALRLREETLALQRSKLGPDHPDTLKSLTSMAVSYEALGRDEEALVIREQTLPLQEAKLGADHPDTLASMINLANSLAASARHGEALLLREKTLALHQTKFGPEHPDTLLCMSNLANSYADIGRQAEALQLREQTLAVRRAKLGPDHPDTLASINNAAVSYDVFGRHEDALKLREESLRLRRTKLGADHPSTLLAMLNAAFSYDALGRHAEALQLREDSLLMTQTKLGPEHPQTLKCQHDLALSYTALGRHQDALLLRERTLSLRKKKLGSEHPDTLLTMYDLADTLADLGRHSDALKLHQETLALRKLKLAPNHRNTLRSMRGVAANLIQLGRGAEAVPIIDDCVQRGGKVVDANLIPDVMDLRLRHFQKAKDAAGCQETAAMLEKLNRTEVDNLFRAARFRAVAAAVVTQDPKIPGADATRLSKEQSDRALEWLRKAIANGFKNLDRLKNDSDLDALRNREEFRKMLSELEAAKG